MTYQEEVDFRTQVESNQHTNTVDEDVYLALASLMPGGEAGCIAILTTTSYILGAISFP